MAPTRFETNNSFLRGYAEESPLTKKNLFSVPLNRIFPVLIIIILFVLVAPYALEQKQDTPATKEYSEESPVTEVPVIIEAPPSNVVEDGIVIDGYANESIWLNTTTFFKLDNHYLIAKHLGSKGLSLVFAALDDNLPEKTFVLFAGGMDKRNAKGSNDTCALNLTISPEKHFAEIGLLYNDPTKIRSEGVSTIKLKYQKHVEIHLPYSELRIDRDKYEYMFTIADIHKYMLLLSGQIQKNDSSLIQFTMN